ncbi:nickel-dependent lactate racemase [Saccharopolyspora hattusasensis]|uniref:nickel-dependent lactate racemase n=1 Tax=Saccharopolyspora hattusasensis TaxID=1128679 RepID=UPI003D98FD63
MPTVRLAYGDAGLDVEIADDRVTIVEPEFHEGAADPAAEVQRVFRQPDAGPPLREVVQKGQTVAVSLCDATRPQPRDLMIPALLAELDGIVRIEDVVLLIATGTHRANTDEELRAMLGDDVVDTVRIVNHDAADRSSLQWCGYHGDDVPVWLNREWTDADFRVTTGFVEPHFFAGFSGGPKMVAPGLAGLDTVLVLHDAARIGSPRATWGVCEGNPVHDDIRAIAAAADVGFSTDVILNRNHEVVSAYGGELSAMHRAARRAARAIAMRALPHRFEVVVTTNSGFPLDQNLYQAVKGMSAAAEIVREGGTIICAAECRDGFPDHGSYRSALSSAESPVGLLAQIADREQTMTDQWQVQKQAQVQNSARVLVHSDYLSDHDLRSAHFTPCADVSEAVEQALHEAGPDARVCVLPDGPQTIPYVIEDGP